MHFFKGGQEAEGEGVACHTTCRHRILTRVKEKEKEEGKGGGEWGKGGVATICRHRILTRIEEKGGGGEKGEGREKGGRRREKERRRACLRYAGTGYCRG